VSLGLRKRTSLLGRAGLEKGEALCRSGGLVREVVTGRDGSLDTLPGEETGEKNNDVRRQTLSKGNPHYRGALLSFKGEGKKSVWKEKKKERRQKMPSRRGRDLRHFFKRTFNYASEERTRLLRKVWAGAP